MRKFLARFRQAPMFSSVYILGSALSVASIMLVAIFLHVKTSNIYPEYGRDKILYCSKSHFTIDTEKVNFATNWLQSSFVSGFSPKRAQTIADSLHDIATVAVILDPNTEESLALEKMFVNSVQTNIYVGHERFENITSFTATPGIFGIYDYEFIEGKPFTDETSPFAVISDRLARRIFGTDKSVIGRNLKLNQFNYGYHGSIGDDERELTVCGVFKEGSRLLPYSFAEIIVPLNLNKEIEEINKILPSDETSTDFQGRFELVILPHPGVTPSAIKDVIEAQNHNQCLQTRTYGQFDGKYFISIGSMILEPGQYNLTSGTYPRGSIQMMLGDPTDIDEEFDFTGLTKLYGGLILILLLVPALNLSSLISGNMDSKMSEMGIRKAFGAKNSTLLRQVINENLWLTGCGAVLGIILSWVGVMMWKDWLFAGVGHDGGALSATDIMLDPAMLFAPKVFVAAIIVCVTLNLLSSLIPAWWALRRPAIDAIKAKS